MNAVELKNLKNVSYKSHELNTGDKRSCGSLAVTYSTDRGPLLFETVFDSSGEPDERTLKFNGEEVEIPDELDFPVFGAPHYYAGARAAKRFEDHFPGEANEVVMEFLKGVEELEDVTPAG